MSEARVKVSVADGTTIEIEGTDAFVTAQLERFGESIRAGLGPNWQAPTAEAPAPPPPPAGPDLTGIFTVTDRGVVQIVMEIPGNSIAEKMVNAAKLLAYGTVRLKHRRTVLFEEVKAACKAHRCYDRKNMATGLKKQRDAFVFGGRGKKQNLALTESGTKEVERMLSAARSLA